MKPIRLTLYDVALGRFGLFKVEVGIREDSCEILDYRMKYNSHRNSWRMNLTAEDKDLIFTKAKEKLNLLKGCGIL